jgi:ketosteroid isomerase-like protein
VTTAEALAEINRDVWKPFVASYTAFDADAFLALYDPDLVRVDGGRGWIGGLAGYGVRTREFFTMVGGRGDVIDIAFRFVERIADGDTASERGVYRLEGTPPGEATRVMFGRFHTIARKRDGVWRILFDYDSDEGGTVDGAAFDAAHDADAPAPFTT